MRLSRINLEYLPRLVILSLRNLGYNKFRSFLTSIGIILGIGAVITTFAASEGLKSYISAENEKMGSNLVFFSPRDSWLTDPKPMSGKDIQYVKKYSTSIKTGTIFEQPKNVDVRHQKHSIANVTPIAIDSEYNAVFSPKIEKGRFLNKREIQDGMPKAVLGFTVAKDLFNGSNPVGKTVVLRTESGVFKLLVTGVFAERGRGFNSTDLQIFLSNRLAKRIFGNQSSQSLVFRSTSKNTVEQAKRETLTLLKPVFGKMSYARTAAEFLRFAKEMSGKFGILGFSLSTICLLVGGIGLMNIMLVSVTERRKEIGIKRAIGFKRSLILSEFLLEAISLCVIGGLIGFVIGSMGGYVLSVLVLEVPAKISIKAFLVAFGFSTLIGTVFGLSPAKKAAGLQPVEVLKG